MGFEEGDESFSYMVSENDDIIFAEEVYKIMGAAFKVYNTLGYGFLEAVYQEALEMELSKRGIPFHAQKEIQLYYDGQLMKKKYIADVLCYDKIILELKVKSGIDGSDRTQLINYLKATGCEAGLVINFGNPRQLDWKKYVFTNKKYLTQGLTEKSTHYSEDKESYTR